MDWGSLAITPARRTDVVSWHGHLPFAFFCIDHVKPRVFVELGTHRGDSYSAFCQRIAELGLDTACYAVDTWQGDDQAGYYDDAIYREFKAYHDINYANFSKLLRMTFDEAVSQFAEGSIDLLHIDGLHTYEAVAHDFMTWLPKMSERGIVLFHDTQVRTDDFGVWRFWEEVSAKYPHFAFEHSNGLGVLAVGSIIPEAIEPVFTEKSKQAMLRVLCERLSDSEYKADPPWLGGHMQLYWDEGQGFDEAQKITHLLMQPQGQFAESFVLMPSWQAIRLDCVDFPARLNDVCVTVERDGQRETQVLAPSKVVALDAQCYLSYTTDPSFYVSLAKSDAQDVLHVTFRYTALSSAALRTAMEKEIEEQHERLGQTSRELALQQEAYERLNELQTIEKMRNQRLQQRQQALESQLRSLTDYVGQIHQTKGWRLLEVMRKARPFVKHPLQSYRKWDASLSQLGWQTTLERVKSKLFAKMIQPNSISYDAFVRQEEGKYLAEQASLRNEITTWVDRPLVSVIMPTYNSKASWLEEAVASLQAQVYPHFELVITDDHSTKEETIEALTRLCALDDRIVFVAGKGNQGISGNTNAGLAVAKGELITFLDHDDLLAPQALYEMVKAYQGKAFAIAYSDEDKLSEDGVYEDAFFKPDYSPDYLLSCNYINHVTVYRRDILERVGFLRSAFDGAQDYDLLLRATEIASPIVHVPQILYHWRKVPGSTAASFDAKSYAQDAGQKAVAEALLRRQTPGAVHDTGYPGHYRVRRELIHRPKVSIIIPMKDKVELIRQCMDSLRRSTYDQYEVIIVDNGSEQEETLMYLATLTDAKVVRYAIPFNYSRLNNWAVKEATGDYLVFLNNDIEVITPDWLEEMLAIGQREEVGAVGARLLYPDERIQHAGIVLGIGGVAGHFHKYASRNYNGYFSSLADIRNFSAVTGACMLMRKSVFEEVGGFNEVDLAVAFNDVDLCLRIRERGYLCVATPYAELFHHESITRGGELNVREVYYMQKKYGDLLELDPYYNVHLTLEHEDHTMDLLRVVTKSSHQYDRKILLEDWSKWFGVDDDVLAKEAVEALRMQVLVRRDLQQAYSPSLREDWAKALMQWAGNLDERDSSYDHLHKFQSIYRQMG